MTLNECRPTVGESYSTATGSSNLRVEADRRTACDMVIAAGMSTHAIGVQLLRLGGEWDRSAKPAPPDPELVKAMAGTFRTEPAGSPYAGLVRELMADGKVTFSLPLAVATRVAAAPGRPAPAKRSYASFHFHISHMDAASTKGTSSTLAVHGFPFCRVPSSTSFGALYLSFTSWPGPCTSAPRSDSPRPIEAQTATPSNG